MTPELVTQYDYGDDERPPFYDAGSPTEARVMKVLIIPPTSTIATSIRHSQKIIQS